MRVDPMIYSSQIYDMTIGGYLILNTSNSHSYKKHLNVCLDLTTPYEETRAGFISFALEKNRRSTPYIEKAKALKHSASSAKTPFDLLDIEDIKPALLTASGLSAKAIKYLEDSHKEEAIEKLIENFLEPAGLQFIDELVYRYLLIEGDSLGGSMRNIAGQLAEYKLTRSIISHLDISQKPYLWTSDKKTWHKRPDNDLGLEEKIKGLSWESDGKPRTLVYNINVPLVRKNVDLCLFNCTPDKYDPNKENDYLLLGELKGGIDPAGADEHWKTANSALERIRVAFGRKKINPYTAFIGAAIAKSMAEEIWDQLENSTLENAANLTVEEQVSSFVRWLIHL